MQKEKKESLKWFVAVLIIVVLFITCMVQSCATVKGLAHDISWTAGKLDESIIVPE